MSETEPLPVAEPGRRVVAYLIDVFVLAAILMPLQFALAAASWIPDDLKASPWRLWLWVLGTVSLPCWLYFTLCEGSVCGATVGKRLMHIRVVDQDGGPLGYVKAFVRTLIKLAPWELIHVTLLLFPNPDAPSQLSRIQSAGLMVSTFLFGSWLVTVLLTPKAQSVHDLIVRTLVLRAREGEKTVTG